MKFVIINRDKKVLENAREAVRKNYLSGKDFYIEVKPYKSKRSNPQNAYYWGAVLPIAADFFGYTVDEMHSEFASKFLPEGEYEGLDGGVRIRAKSTAKLNTSEFNDYVEQIKIFMASEFGCHIPDPE